MGRQTDFQISGRKMKKKPDLFVLKVLTLSVLFLLFAPRSEAFTVESPGAYFRETKYGPTVSLQLVCIMGIGSDVYRDYELRWSHSTSASGDYSRTNLAVNDTLKVSSALYGVDLQTEGNITTYKLTLKTVQVTMDGAYRCSAVPKLRGAAYGHNIELTVLQDVQSLELFPPGEGPPVTSDVEQPVNVSEGKYRVTCRSNGFNSNKAYVILRFDNGTLIKVSRYKMRNESMSRDTGAWRYYMAATAKNLELTAAESGRIIICEATANFTGAITKRASFPITIPAGPTAATLSSTTLSSTTLASGLAKSGSPQRSNPTVGLGMTLAVLALAATYGTGF